MATSQKFEDQDFETNYDEIFDNFDNMTLQEDLLRGIYAYGFEKPSAIQARAIKPLASTRHIIAQAQSGTGKTATFSIGILQQLDYTKNECQALILAPTRELAQQIQKVEILLNVYLTKIRSFLLLEITCKFDATLALVVLLWLMISTNSKAVSTLLWVPLVEFTI
jgi:superfamily II DNA/RNA helicase